MKLNETVYLTAIPIAGTAAAFLFEMGFCHFHGIPKSLISMTPSRVVVACIAITIMAFFIHFYFSLGLAFLTRRKGVAFRMLGLGMMYSFFLFILLFTSGGTVGGWVAFGVAFCIPGLIGLICTIRDSDAKGSFSERWWNESKSVVYTGADNTTDGLERIIEFPTMFMTTSLLLCAVCFFIGTRYAQLFEPSRVLESKPSQALLIVYGEHWIFRPVDDVEERHLVKPSELLVLSGSSADNISLLPIKKPLKAPAREPANGRKAITEHSP